MPILFNRLYAYVAQHGVQLQPMEKRRELGKLVAQAYHAQGDKKPLKLIPFTEEGIKYRVLYYPPTFTPQMDAIISKFYQDNPPPERRKPRPRIQRKPVPLNAKFK